MEVEKRLDQMRQQHIPEKDWDKVIFHATDIYHGSGYFDRLSSLPQSSNR